MSAKYILQIQSFYAQFMQKTKRWLNCVIIVRQDQDFQKLVFYPAGKLPSGDDLLSKGT